MDQTGDDHWAERAPEPFTSEECATLNTLPGDHGRVLRFMLATGIRWGEMTRAQAKDIRDGMLLIRKSKSGKVRRVPVPSDVPTRDLSKVQRFHSHLARHAFAAHWLDAGGSLAGLKVVLGHSFVAVTEQYGRIGDDLVMHEARRLEAYQHAANE